MVELTTKYHCPIDGELLVVSVALPEPGVGYSGGPEDVRCAKAAEHTDNDVDAAMYEDVCIALDSSGDFYQWAMRHADSATREPRLDRERVS